MDGPLLTLAGRSVPLFKPFRPKSRILYFFGVEDGLVCPPPIERVVAVAASDEVVAGVAIDRVASRGADEDVGDQRRREGVNGDVPFGCHPHRGKICA